MRFESNLRSTIELCSGVNCSTHAHLEQLFCTPFSRYMLHFKAFRLYRIPSNLDIARLTDNFTQVPVVIHRPTYIAIEKHT